MTVYANTTLPEVEELVQGAKIAAIHEECGALFVEMAAWEDEDGVMQCETLCIRPYIDEHGKEQLSMEYHDNPGPATCNNGVGGE
mgnify:FL=1